MAAHTNRTARANTRAHVGVRASVSRETTRTTTRTITPRRTARQSLGVTMIITSTITTANAPVDAPPAYESIIDVDADHDGDSRDAAFHAACGLSGAIAESLDNFYGDDSDVFVRGIMRYSIRDAVDAVRPTWGVYGTAVGGTIRDSSGIITGRWSVTVTADDE